MPRRAALKVSPKFVESIRGLIAGANLIRVGVTTQAEQALPISGGFIGNADDPTGLHVDVSVRAVPIQ